MARDADLRRIFREHFKGWQWSSIETWTCPGLPDSEYCAGEGIGGWVEFKRVLRWRVTFEPFQPAWIDRRARLGGRVNVAVRRQPVAYRDRGRDELWLIPGSMVLTVAESGLQALSSDHLLGIAGPASWDWRRVEDRLTGTAHGVALGPDDGATGVPHSGPIV